jgi:hypothetical protein
VILPEQKTPRAKKYYLTDSDEADDFTINESDLEDPLNPIARLDALEATKRLIREPEPYDPYKVAAKKQMLKDIVHSKHDHNYVYPPVATVSYYYKKMCVEHEGCQERIDALTKSLKEVTAKVNPLEKTNAALAEENVQLRRALNESQMLTGLLPVVPKIDLRPLQVVQQVRRNSMVKKLPKMPSTRAILSTIYRTILSTIFGHCGMQFNFQPIFVEMC